MIRRGSYILHNIHSFLLARPATPWDKQLGYAPCHLQFLHVIPGGSTSGNAFSCFHNSPLILFASLLLLFNYILAVCGFAVNFLRRKSNFFTRISCMNILLLSSADNSLQSG